MALLCTFSSFSIPCFRYGLHTWKQYSNCGLTNVLYNPSIVSLSLVTSVLLIIPKVVLAFFDASAHCLDGFALLCIITPKSLSSSLTFNSYLPFHTKTLGFSSPCAQLSIFLDYTAFATSMIICS